MGITNRLIVFIHGLDGDAVRTWGKFPELLRNDADVVSRYTRISSFPYKTGKLVPTRPLSEIASELSIFIEAKMNDLKIDEIAFITHSQGGLLARRYLCDVLLKKSSQSVRTPIFRLLTFATPHWGAYSELIGRTVPDACAQQKELAYDSDSILAVNKDWVKANAEDRIRVQRVIAGEDRIVPKFSALGANFENDYLYVTGYGHTNIVKVNEITHPSFIIAKAFLLAPTSHQPALVNPDKTPPVLSAHWHKDVKIEGASRFVYSTRYVLFFGREREQSQLMEFLYSPAEDNMSWMWVKGQGGVGKSRLALELCIACQSDWHAGFLNRDANAPDWARWQPKMPTLLVIDYSTADTDKLGRLLRGLCNRDAQRRLQRQVRVLLLDRNQQEDRLLQAIGHGADAVGIKNCRKPDLDLLTIDDPWAIIEDFMSRAGMPKPDKAQALDRLTRVDPAKRPLFAMLLADALAQNKDIGTITRESIIENVIEREREKYWLPAAKGCSSILAKHERWLAFATMVNGLALAMVQSPIDQWDPDVSAPVFEVMSGYDRQSNTIAPLGPDLIGECFALQKLNLLEIPKAQDILNLLWNQWPTNAWQFLIRVAQDFPNDAMLDVALNFIPDKTIGQTAWSFWVVDLTDEQTIIRLSSSRIELAYKILSTHATFNLNQFPPLSQHFQARAGLYLLSNLPTLDRSTAKKIILDLRALADEHPLELDYLKELFDKFEKSIKLG